MTRCSGRVSGRVGQSLLLLLGVMVMVILVGTHAALAQEPHMLVRMSEIHVDPAYLGEYTAILKEEADASVRLEPGVVAIFPMSQKDSPAEFRILEIYASRDAYESHLQTPHFQRYKTTTLKMVTSLKLVDMEAVDADAMVSIFRKMSSAAR